jgi:hypothetical protein
VFNIKYLNTVGRFIYTKYWEILYVEYWEDLFIQNTGKYFMLNTVGRCIETKYWGIVYVKHYWKMYSHSVQHKVFLSILYK